MTARINLSELHVRRFQDDVARLENALRGVVAGQDRLIAQLVTAVLAGGHVLLEGLPGLGKTNLAKAVARVMGLELARIQCTPDLMPADITGGEILMDGGDGQRQRLEFRPGPVFASVVLVDEINRSPPKTQAALLEAMQEGQVTYGGSRYSLPSPFWVLATQNPIELEGTYPLPEAQLDRFGYKLTVDYPAREALIDVIDRSLDREPVDIVETVVPIERVRAMMAEAREVVLARPIKQAAVDLVLATHPIPPGDNALARRHFRYGASPRALQALLRAARVSALADGRGHVSRGDIETCALAVLRHRVLLTIDSQLENLDMDELLSGIVAQWKQRG